MVATSDILTSIEDLINLEQQASYEKNRLDALVRNTPELSAYVKVDWASLKRDVFNRVVKIS